MPKKFQAQAQYKRSSTYSTICCRDSFAALSGRKVKHESACNHSPHQHASQPLAQNVSGVMH